MKSSRETPIMIIVRKKRPHGGGHGGAWKVALADFMTAMFSLFLVLWLVNQSSDVKSAIAGYFQDPLGRADEYGSSIVPGNGAPQELSPRFRQEADALDIRREKLREVAAELQKRLDEAPLLASARDYVEIKLTDDGLRIELMEDSVGVFFELGRPRPSERGRAILELLGTELGQLPNEVRIEGHTDAWPFHGTDEYTNWELSADRANTARRILTESGLKEPQISEVTGFADREPRLGTDPFSARNRRITITMLTGDSLPAVQVLPPPARIAG